MKKMRPKECTEPALTADAKLYSNEQQYFFFDGEKVRDTNGLRRVDFANLGSMGLKIVPISQLRERRDDAISDAQKFFLTQIDSHRDRIRELEAEKSPKNRSLKAVLMARD